MSTPRNYPSLPQLDLRGVISTNRRYLKRTTHDEYEGSEELGQRLPHRLVADPDLGEDFLRDGRLHLRAWI